MPKVLCIVKTTVVRREELPLLITSTSISPMSGSSRSEDGLTLNSSTCVEWRSRRAVWKVPSPSSSRILSPVSLSYIWIIDLALCSTSTLNVSASKPVLNISSRNGVNSSYSTYLGTVWSKSSGRVEFAICTSCSSFHTETSGGWYTSIFSRSSCRMSWSTTCSTLSTSASATALISMPSGVPVRSSGAVSVRIGLSISPPALRV